jgi:hypothetical protein
MQRVANGPSNPIEKAIRAELDLPDEVTIDWRSPRADDDFAEYRDSAFLERVGLERFQDDLKSYWPSRGPQWDALAVTSDDKVILVEAKAHTSEMASSCEAGPKSRKVIDRALNATKGHYLASPDADWTKGYYQYANRLAHLRFLRERGVDAHLVFIYFTGDYEMRGPRAMLEWEGAIAACDSKLGLPKDRSVPGLHSVFIDVGQ